MARNAMDAAMQAEAEDIARRNCRDCEAWAIWNSCHGVFDCSVRGTRKECEEILPHYDATAEIVPVRIVVEDRDEWWRRLRAEGAT